LPTITFHTFMMALALVACNVDYIIEKLDIKGAFIQAKIRGMPVYIRCTGQSKELIPEQYQCTAVCRWTWYPVL
jgi:hypothetical protein